jgi:hypothetical protein
VVQLYDSDNKFPVAVVAVKEILDAQPIPTEPTPALGRNTKMAFGCGEELPIDTERLKQLVGIMKGMGYVMQAIDSRQRFDDFAFITIRFAQGNDPRVPSKT